MRSKIAIDFMGRFDMAPSKSFVLGCVTIIATIAINCAPGCVLAQPLATAKICGANDFWADCAKKVKAAISKTDDPKVALAAAAEWGDKFNTLYLANAQKGWSASDQDRLQQAMDLLWDESIGKYLDPAGLAFDLALKRYLPSIAAAMSWASTPQVVFLYGLLAPSPIANSFTEARPFNSEINALLATKFPPSTAQTIKERYPELFRRGLEKSTNGMKVP